MPSSMPSSQPSSMPSAMPSSMPSSEPTSEPSSMPSSTDCTICDDERTPWMKDNGKYCTNSYFTENFCNKKQYWKNNKFCRRSCYDAGYGYAGDVCC
mmetsp:Transcript_12657/g.18952  ORF Transcript_12657/g.18952 Transcript_12657/m.18952 type:complete len:97 (+) Transcript_12657:1-291(+)